MLTYSDQVHSAGMHRVEGEVGADSARIGRGRCPRLRRPGSRPGRPPSRRLPAVPSRWGKLRSLDEAGSRGGRRRARRAWVVRLRRPSLPPATGHPRALTFPPVRPTRHKSCARHRSCVEPGQRRPGNHLVHIEPIQTVVADTIGAGDSYMSVHGSWLRDITPTQCPQESYARWANSRHSLRRPRKWPRMWWRA